MTARAARTGLALAAAVSLASCGFDYATDRDYTVATGVSDRSGQVDVLGAVVVSATEGEGTFIATLSNNSATEAASFEQVAAADGGDLTVTDFDPIEVPADGLVNLADSEEPVKVTGDFEAGNFVRVAVSFGSGQTSLMDIPVVADSGYYEGLDAPTVFEDQTSETEG